MQYAMNTLDPDRTRSSNPRTPSILSSISHSEPNTTWSWIEYSIHIYLITYWVPRQALLIIYRFTHLYPLDHDPSTLPIALLIAYRVYYPIISQLWIECSDHPLIVHRVFSHIRSCVKSLPNRWPIAYRMSFDCQSCIRIVMILPDRIVVPSTVGYGRSDCYCISSRSCITDGMDCVSRIIMNVIVDLYRSYLVYYPDRGLYRSRIIPTVRWDCLDRKSIVGQGFTRHQPNPDRVSRPNHTTLDQVSSTNNTTQTTTLS